MGGTRFNREVHRNYASIFITVQPRQEVHYQYGPDSNLFQYGSQYYIELCGDRSMNVCLSSGSTMRITVALTVTAAGGLLPHMFIFKAKLGGHVQ